MCDTTAQNIMNVCKVINEFILRPLKINGLTVSPSKKICGLVIHTKINPIVNITNVLGNLDIINNNNLDIIIYTKNTYKSISTIWSAKNKIMTTIYITCIWKFLHTIFTIPF